MKNSLVILILATLLPMFSYSQSPNIQGTVWRPNLEIFTAIERNITRELDSLSSPAAKLHPEYGIPPANAPCTDCIELIDARTESTRYFVVNGSGGNHFFTQTSKGVLHYMDTLGRWISINRRMKVEAPGVFVSRQSGAPVTINTVTQEVTIGFGDEEFRFAKLSLEYVDATGTSTDFGPMDWSEYTAGDNGIRIYDAWDGVDVEVIRVKNGVKTNYIITKRLPISEDGYLVFRDATSLPDNAFYSLGEGSGVDALWDGKVDIVSPQGTLATFERGYAHDDSWRTATVLDEIPLRFSNVYYTFLDENISTHVPASWLASDERVYPITIDPLVTTSNTYGINDIRFRSVDAAFCAGNFGCSAVLGVNRPVNSELISAKLEFSYEAGYGVCVDPCLMANAGVQMSSSPCLGTLPTDSTFYTCGGPDGYFTGTCVFEDIDISDYIHCLDNACTGTYNFTCRNSFCGCTIGGMCVTGAMSCVVLLDDEWTIEIEGRNLETLGDIVDGNGLLVIDTVCCTSVTLDPLADLGMGPYTYLWSDGSTGSTLVVAICEDTTVTYTCTVKDACNMTRIATFQITIDDCGAVLPITLASFDAVWEGDHVIVHWETETEVENSAYILSRSSDGREYETIYTVQGAGTSITTHSYEFHDWDFWPSVNYYKLTSVDESGVVVDEAIDIVAAPRKLKAELYPNPTTNTVTVSLSDEWVVNAIIVNSLGETIGSVSLQDAETEVDVSHLPKGLYFVRLMNVQSEEVLSFIKI